MLTPNPPVEFADLGRLLYYLALGLAILCALTFAWLLSTRFGLALNAIRDDEDKADAMGFAPTLPRSPPGWRRRASLARLVRSTGNLVRFIDPIQTAFAGATIGVWMIVMALLGGRGTLLGPIIGAIVFQVTKELFWTYLLGWQRVALGLLIVLVAVFFPQVSSASCVSAEASGRGRGGRMTAMLALNGVTKAFGGVIANDGISIAVPEGAIVGLIGPNGSGKTTLFNAITGTHAIDSGSIRFKDNEISRLLTGDIARAGLIRTYQQPRVYGGLSAIDNMRVSASIQGAQG
ncbi:MAG: ATP-binding cassette domain-containing protein [Hyphomicrobiales bacterium]